MKRLIYLFLTACVLCSCKDAEVRTNFVVFPYIQLTRESQRELTPDVKAYAYYGDTTSWRVASWQDALIGKLTSKTDETQTRLPDFTAEPDEVGKLVLGPIVQKDFIVLVCHTDPDAAADVEMYAWRNAETTENLSLINVSMMFKPWRTETRWVESRWAFISKYPPEAPENPDDTDDNENPELLR